MENLQVGVYEQTGRSALSDIIQRNTDLMGREVTFSWPPQRIISLVPSQTELLVDLGLEDRVVGVTKFCVHPEGISKRKARVGGTKKFDFEKIAFLKPDLIIGNKEENEQGQIEELSKSYPVWMSDIRDLDGAFVMIAALGEICGAEEKAAEMRKQIQGNFSSLKPGLNKRAAYLIWRKPWMAAGGDTFIDDMLRRCGLQNVFRDATSRYPSFKETELQQHDPELILLSSEPYPFKDRHIAELKEICPRAELMLVDGEMFSWYGSRLLKTADYLNKIFAERS